MGPWWKCSARLPCLLLVILLAYNCILVTSAEKTLAVVGESGVGKSSFTKAALGRDDIVVGEFSSITNETEGWAYVPSKGLKIFEDFRILDTPGIHDTKGRSDKQILQNIEAYFLRLRQSQVNSVDGFIFMVSALDERLHMTNDLTKFITEFAENVLKSTVILINKANLAVHLDAQKFDRLKREVENEAVRAAALAFPKERYTIPVVVYNALNPSQEEQRQLDEALKQIKPYILKDLDIKRKAIEDIFHQILADPSNYKKEVDKVVKEETRKVLRQALQSTVKCFEEIRYVAEKFSLDVGIFKVSIPKKVTEQKCIPVDEIIELAEEQKVPIIEEIKKDVLKNEEDHYWRVAVEKYEEMNKQRYFKP